MMKSIYLVGFMGSGKTSISEQLQKKLNYASKDTDEMIEEHYEMTIPTIFADKGEDVFRQFETNILKKTPIQDTVIATGGGIIEKEENREWLKTHGKVIFLDTSWEEISRRLQNDESRPIWNNKSRDKLVLLEKRLPLYKEVANYEILTDNKNVEEIVEEIVSKLRV